MADIDENRSILRASWPSLLPFPSTMSSGPKTSHGWSWAQILAGDIGEPLVFSPRPVLAFQGENAWFHSILHLSNNGVLRSPTGPNWSCRGDILVLGVPFLSRPKKMPKSFSRMSQMVHSILVVVIVIVQDSKTIVVCCLAISPWERIFYLQNQHLHWKMLLTPPVRQYDMAIPFPHVRLLNILLVQLFNRSTTFFISALHVVCDFARSRNIILTTWSWYSQHDVDVIMVEDVKKSGWFRYV